MSFEEAIEYIRRLLTYDIDGLFERIHYISSDEVDSIDCSGDIIIVQSNFFDRTQYGGVNSIPYKCFDYDNLKVIFGQNLYAQGENTVIYADLIASTFFLISRYEEYVRNECRDCYGNFPAKEAFLVKNNLLDRPLVDEYSKYILQEFSKLDSREYVVDKGFNTISLTHDIDVPFNQYNSFIHMAKAIGKNLLSYRILDVSPLTNWLGDYRINPRDTWKYMLRRERHLKENSRLNIEIICFIIAIDVADSQSMAYIADKKTKPILVEMEKLGAELGLHTSYRGAEDSRKVGEEKKRLEGVINKRVSKQRNHYLRQINPIDIGMYQENGFEDDYTCGYNEMPGFKLGTTRVVKWVNPQNGRVYNINLHGLHIMDGSLIGAAPYQLGLEYETAIELSRNIMKMVNEYHGDLCILWHNNSFKINELQKSIYDWIIDCLLSDEAIYGLK